MTGVTYHHSGTHDFDDVSSGSVTTEEGPNTERYATAYPGSDLGEQLNNAIADFTNQNAVYVPKGAPTLSTKVDLPDGTVIRGDSIKGSLIQADGGYSGEALIHYHPSGATTFEGLDWLKLSGNDRPTKGFLVDQDEGGNARDVHIDHVFMTNFAEEAMRTEVMHGFRISNSLFEFSGADLSGADDAAVKVTAGQQGYMNNIYMAQNETSWAMDFQGRGCHLTNLQCKLNDVGGIKINGLRNIITNIYLKDNNQSGVGVTSQNKHLVVQSGQNKLVNIHALGNNSVRQGIDIITGTGTVLLGFKAVNHTNHDLHITTSDNIVGIGHADVIDIDGNDNQLWGVSYNSYSDSGTRNILNGRVTSPETLSLGGSDGWINPTVLPVETLPVRVDAGGSATELEAINGDIRREGQSVRVIHTGGENVTLVHNDTTENDPLINQGGANVTLGTNGDMAEFSYSSQASKWIMTGKATTQ